MQTNFAKNNYNNNKLSQNGFTLIELVIVIVIIAILFTYTTLAIRGNDPEELIQEEARRLERLTELALEETVLRGEEYGIEFFIDGYRFLRFNDEYNWEVVTHDPILRKRMLPEKMELETRLEDSPLVISLSTDILSDGSLELNKVEGDQDEESTEKLYPHVYLLSSGEIAPDFDVRFYLPNVKASYFVNGNFDGELSTKLSDL